MNNNAQEKLLDILAQLHIPYDRYDHEPVFTVEQAAQVVHTPAAETKNLFLKDDRKQHYLVCARAETRVPLKEFGKIIDAKNIRFAQANVLLEMLGVQAGSVTAFAILNDTQHTVRIILDKALFDADLVGFHPLRNDATLVFDPKHLHTFFKHLGRDYTIFDFDTMQPVE